MDVEAPVSGTSLWHCLFHPGFINFSKMKFEGFCPTFELSFLESDCAGGKKTYLKFDNDWVEEEECTKIRVLKSD